MYAAPGMPLSARIVMRRPLRYRAGPDAALDRPAHVRAASSLCWVGERLAIVQDDAHFLALVDPATGLADAIALPAGADGKRVFDEARGTKHLKLDLEASLSYRDEGGTHLMAFGSGSLPARERIVTFHFADGASAPDSVRVHEASALYALLRANTRFSGSELNLEGALRDGASVLLFQRGNGAPARGLLPRNAIGQLDFDALARYLAGAGPAPALIASRSFDLGSAQGVPYGFTDATMTPAGGVLFLASAEASADVTRDGAVHGTLIGELLADGSVRTAPLLDEQGRISNAKAEGLVLDKSDSEHAWLVVDADSGEQPAELLEVRLARD